MNNLKIGSECYRLRRSLGFTQSNVAEDLGYSVENISAFENGRNSNMKILIWYLEHGLDVKKLWEAM